MKHLTYRGVLLGLFEISTVHSASSVAGHLIVKSFVARLPISPGFSSLACLK